MEKSLLIAVLYIGFDLLHTVSGFPIDLSSLGAGETSTIWLTSNVLTAVGFLLTAIVVLLGCICCRNGKGFKEFSNSSGSLAISRPESFPTSNSELTIFPPAQNSNQICRFEPLPDIKPQAPNLRPAAFSYSEREISSQDWFSEPYNNFSRYQLKYLQEYGRGWFGRVVEGEAQNITPKEKLTKVMVKILHEDATPTDQMYFLHEVKFYRDLKHPNILRLLGRCLETEPFLIILECYPNGDLKSFLSQNLASAQALVEQGVTLKMCSNITSGLQYMHANKFIHTDLAARNCLVGPDLTIKIGDYGNSIEVFKSDYYCAGSVALPVRWCAPETLKCTDVTIETREVTPPANIWSLAVVFWEICEFCKLPYAELNDDQVIVRVLGEKNYFLDRPSMFCLYKDELYHLMKLCWSSPMQRPTASQIYVILDNLISSGKTIQKEVQIDSKRVSQDFEQRWKNLKPNYIPKKDNALENDSSTNCNIISSKLKNAKVGDSSLDSPLGIFMSDESCGQESPRFCLKSGKEKTAEVSSNIQQEPSEKKPDKESNEADGTEKIESVTNLKKPQPMVNFEINFDGQKSDILNSDPKFKRAAPDVDSWLRGVEINNEEDESFVRKISEAIRDLDATLELEKTSSSEEASGKSSHQNSPGKDIKENVESGVDFKLGGDISSFMNFTQKSFELTSLQNTEQPQSLDFTDPFLTENKKEFDDCYGPCSLIMPLIDESKSKFNIKNDIFDESLKENESFVCSQSRNSSDTDDEIWRKRIERGEISEKVKEKSKSIANLMILTHIDASDDSDVDLDKPFDKGLNRNSFLRKSGSFAKTSLSSNNFGSENDITYAVLEDDFKESLKKLSNDHKEHGHFDSLDMILPTSVRRENIWEQFFKESDNKTSNSKTIVPQTDVNKTKEVEESGKEKTTSQSNVEENIDNISDSSNNFLGKVASEKLNDNKLPLVINENEISSNETSKIVDFENDCKENNAVEVRVECDNYSNNNNDNRNSSKENSSHLKGSFCESSNITVNCNETQNLDVEKSDTENNFKEVEIKIEKEEKPLVSVVSENLLLTQEKVEHENLRKCETENSTPNQSVLPYNENSIFSTNEVDINDKKNVKSFENESLNLKSQENVKQTIPEITMTEVEDEVITEPEEVFEPVPMYKPFKFVFKNNEKELTNLNSRENSKQKIPEIVTTLAQEEDVKMPEEVFEQVVPKRKPFRFVLKDKDFIPQIIISEEPEDIIEEEEVEFEFTKPSARPFKFVLRNNEIPRVKDSEVAELENSTQMPLNLPLGSVLNTITIKDESNSEKVELNNDSTVIIGACEDFTLDYFKGLKTTSEGVSVETKVENETDKKYLQNIIEDLQNKEANLDVWDQHLEKAFTQQLKYTDFNDVNFKSLDFPETDLQLVSLDENKKESNFIVASSPCSIKSTADFIESEKVHTEKVEEPIINGLTSLTDVGCDEEYENFKLRTPDDERSSDSGFRDKGSLSESVEDACEGKYNLEDIEAELEEAYVKGAFGNCEVEKEKNLSKDDSKNCNNFEYEESKFYEDENKHDEDFSDIDGEIEFWQNKDNSDYYPEISEFNPTCSQGWYLHPPDENMLNFNRNVNEDIVNALRNELRENLPVQTRSFTEFDEDFYVPEVDTKRELNIHYLSDIMLPLSPIIEEQDSFSNKTFKKNLKNTFSESNNSNRIRRNGVNLMESVKSIDTNTFMQYLDYMIENEGRDLDEIEEANDKSIEESENKEDLPMLMLEKVSPKNSDNGVFEAEIKNALGINSESRSESLISDAEQSNVDLLLEDLESGGTSKIVHEVKPEDDILVVNVDTNEMTLLESPKPKSYHAFVETLAKKEDCLEVITDNSENDGLVFTPEMLSPDRERSLSEISRSSNGTRTGDALSDITLSSPDLVPDCFSTFVQEIVQNNEANEIIKELEDSGIINEVNTTNSPSSSGESNSTNSSDVLLKAVEQNDVCLLEEEKKCPDLLEKPLKSPEKTEDNKSRDLLITDQKPSLRECEFDTEDIYEMTTSFMGDDDDDDDYDGNGSVNGGGGGDDDSESYSKIKETNQRQEDNDQISDKLVVEDSYTPDWESESSGGEEDMSSSSGEFIWKNGDKESKVKAVRATDCDTENSLHEKSQSDHSAADIGTNNSSPIKEITVQDKSEKAGNEDEDDDESSTGSSASIADFVPSAWNSQATPVKSALKSPDKKEDQQQKKNVWFKQQKYHCVYEYPREPSDNEDADSSSYDQFTYERNGADTQNKHFNFGVNTLELPNKHFPYGISNVVDYSSFTDWDVAEEDGADLSLTDTDSDNGLGKSEFAPKQRDFNFYNLSPFDYDFNSSGILDEDSEFYVSSSSRPFQGGLSSQFFPGSSQVFYDANNTETANAEAVKINPKDFTTPDSGLEDSDNVTPLEKKVDVGHNNNFLQVDVLRDTKPKILNILDNLKFNFTTEILETNLKNKESFPEDSKSNSNELFSSSSNNSSSQVLSSCGLGDLRHTRDKLKLDLPRNHNAELGEVVNKKNQQNSLIS